MNKAISSVVVLGVVGLIVGYFLFGKTGGGNYVSIGDLFRPARSGLAGLGQRLSEAVRGIEEMRRNILISGLVGAVVGLVAGLAMNRSGR